MLKELLNKSKGLINKIKNMPRKLLNKPKHIINKTKQKKIKNTEKQSKIQYETLLPENNIENKSEDILDYAVKKANVNNIAITGGYSAGKSSVINSYFKKIKKVKFISLATFKEEKNNKKIEQNSEEKTIKSYKNNNITIQEVEKTILEKLYYSSYAEKSKKKKYYHILITTFIFYILFSIIHNNIVDLALKLHIIIGLVFIIIIEIFTFLLIYFVIRKISELTSLKLKLGEIEVDATIKERNILNENLNMIIEIIKKAKYKYIIFEDLDRFECPEIFEHLRDLNITLNSALVKPVKFIYAVRDDIFENENRTKFFDMIIPVVPYVSFENSGTELYRIIKEEYKLPELEENFIKKLCLFVSDMRILKNTLNEYVVYKKELDNPKLSKETSFYKNLFAMMLYKNTCSHDFALLQQHDGIVFSILNNGQKYKEEKINKINEKIDSYNKEENLIENEYIYDKNYFIDVLIAEIRRKFPSNDRIKIANNESVSLSITMDRSVFEEDLFSPDFKIYHYANGAHEWITMAEFLEQNLQDLYQKYKLVRGKEML